MANTGSRRGRTDDSGDADGEHRTARRRTTKSAHPRLTRGLDIRWSRLEAEKPYARPFGVLFLHKDGSAVGGVAVNGPDLLYYRQFQTAVLELTGDLYREEVIEMAADPQGMWLDHLATLLPLVEEDAIRVLATFDEDKGRTYRFAAGDDNGGIHARQLLEYQEFQAAVAHKTGALYRDAVIEKISDPAERQTEWVRRLGDLLRRPDVDVAVQ